MTPIQGSPDEIHELASYEVRPEALDTCIAAIHEFVAYVRENECGRLSLVSQRMHWIDARGPQRRDVSSRQSDECEHNH